MSSKFSIINILKIHILIILFANITTAQVSEDWSHRYTGPKASADEPSDLAVDNAGNIYITGRSLVGGDFYNFITVKFNPSGIRQWVAKFNGPPFSNSVGNSIQVDNSGNVYVTGYTRIGSGQIDLLLIKYNSNGIQQWLQQYNGPGNFDDFGISVDVDSAGNVYAGGYSFGTGTSYDFVLLKYNAGGINQWTRRWNGVTNNSDYLKKISVSSNGDVVASGYSFKSTTSNDFTTVKYNTSGDLLWVSQYNSTFNNDDQVTNLKVDNQKNVYVCGISRGSGLGYDFAVVKYNSAGVEQWSQRYDSPGSNNDEARSVDTDADGNVIVGGFSYQPGTQFDFATVKYNSAGVQQWIRFYNGENLYDKAADLKTDVAGNIYVTGSSINTATGSNDVVILKYNTAGTLTWTKSYDGPGNLDDIPVKLVLNNSQEPVVTASSYSYFFSILCGSSDYLALQYSPAGNLEIETRYDGSGLGDDESVAICTDNKGNSFITGFSYDDNSDYDYATLKYNSAGAPLWAVRYDGGNNGTDKPVSIGTDLSGNVYVTGTSRGSSGNNDITTVKYNSSGTYQWEARYNGPANGDDQATGFSVDAAGNSFVTGFSEGTGSGKDYVTIKYSPAGVQQWASRFNGPGNSNDYSNAICIDVSGNSFVTGKATGVSTLLDIYTIKYNSSGVQQWAAVFNGAANDSDEADCIALDPSGNVLTGGKSKSSSSDADGIIIKYNSSGNQQWFRTFSGSALNSKDEIISVAADNSNNIIASGSTNNLISGYDILTIKYNSSGDVLWNASLNGTAGSDDRPNSLLLDQAGNSYITGYTKDLISGINYCTFKLNRDGFKAWEKKYNYIDNDTDKATMMALDTLGNVFVTGFSTSADSKRDFFTVKYTQPKTLSAKILTEARYNTITGKMIPDTVKMIVRSAAPPYNIVDSSRSVTDSAGNCIFGFTNVQNGVSYYLVADHRNSMETWSAAGNTFTANSLYYDFTVSASQAYGNNLKLKGSKYCIYSGDVNKDGIVDLTDLIFIYNRASKFTSGYTIGDINGDEIVDLTDLIFTYNNATDFISLERP